MDLNRERWQKNLGKKRRRSRGKALGGKAGKGSDLSGERGGKILGRKGGRSGGKGLRGERGDMISTGKGVEKILGRKGRRSGGKKASKEGKGRALRGGKALGGKGWEGSQQGIGRNNLRKEKGEDLERP